MLQLGSLDLRVRGCNHDWALTVLIAVAYSENWPRIDHLVIKSDAILESEQLDRIQVRETYLKACVGEIVGRQIQ